jgi:hypothetical protein
LVGVACTGPDREVVDVGVGQRRIRLLRDVRRAPDDPFRSHHSARLCGKAVVLPDVHAVGVTGGDQVGPVVEDEQRTMGVGGGAERAGGGHDPGVVERLVAQLDHVDSAQERGVEEGL